MKKTEIYKIKFDKWTDGTGIPHWSIYMIDAPGWLNGEMQTPREIKIVKTKAIVTFEDGGTHEFTLTDKDEIFRRPIKPKEDGRITESNDN
jgi:hypothetical protein